MKKLAILASGGGSNARAICAHFDSHPSIQIGLILTDNPNAGVLSVADDYKIPTMVLNKTQRNDSSYLLGLLHQYQIDFVILAGYLKLIPKWLINAYQDKILNIHPSLLPKYGGQGMYGMHVHQAVKDNMEMVSGMTVHLVNERFDEGKIIFQATTPLSPDMTSIDIAKTVLVLEHKYYSVAIEKFVNALK